MSKKSYLKIIILGIIVIALLFPFAIGISTLFADDEKLTLSKLIEDYQNQEITDDLTFLTDFEPEENNTSINLSENGWTLPEYKDSKNQSLLTNPNLDWNDRDENGKNDNALYVVNLSSDDFFYYGDNQHKFSSQFGNNSEGYGLFFITSKNGVLGAETEIEIPAQVIYVLTFKVNLGFAGQNGLNAKINGLNAKIIDGDNITSMSSNKEERNNYISYSFLIRGHEFNSKTVKLQLLWGNIEKNKDDSYSVKNEIGYAVVDSIRMFSVNFKQYEELASDTIHNKQVNLFNSTSSQFIKNGYFNQIKNNNWELENNPKIMDSLPEHWMQETQITDESNRVAHYGVVNVNSNKLSDLEFINPGSCNSNENNNVLLLYNGDYTASINTYQTIRSTEFKLAKNNYYEISFKFNTPALKNTASEENNSLNFYVVKSDGTNIYSREDMFSYTEWEENANEWTTFRLFIKTSDAEEKLKFVIKFGTEENTKSGYAYIDEINLSGAKTSANTVFDNTKEDKYPLKNDDEEITYLAAGMLSFSDLEKLDFSSEMTSTTGANRSLAIFDYTAPENGIIDGEGEEEEEEDTVIVPEREKINLSYLWYVIPSILLGVCTILGLIIFYGNKFKKKIKFPKRRKNNSYDRRKTLNKQVSSREKIQAKNNVEKDLKSIKKQIDKLESDYQKSKSNPTALKEYIRKRERLQNQELRLKEKLTKNKS